MNRHPLGIVNVHGNENVLNMASLKASKSLNSRSKSAGTPHKENKGVWSQTIQVGKKRKISDVVPVTKQSQKISKQKFTIFQDATPVTNPTSDSTNILLEQQTKLQEQAQKITELETIIMQQNQNLEIQLNTITNLGKKIELAEGNITYFSTLYGASNTDVESYKQEKNVLEKTNSTLKTTNSSLIQKLKKLEESNESLLDEVTELRNDLKRQEQSDAFLRRSTLKSTQEAQELRFMNELLIQQLADKETKNVNEVKMLKQALSERDLQLVGQVNHYRMVVNQLKEHMHVTVTDGQKKIQSLETLLEKERLRNTKPAPTSRALQVEDTPMEENTGTTTA
ncbi:laminin subunit beta [Acrasis kona]|uniref:Laminin subunit beta n=1 Tax=Acrasis kona TaxID=1008807 RepID=A0AAW2YKG3_9EUKA